MPHPYILQVFSQPTAVSDELWRQWYLEEHIRDMVYFGVVKTACFYHAIGQVFSYNDPPAHQSDDTSFLAHFQVDSSKPLSNPNFKEKVRQTTELWGGKRGREVGQLKDIASELVTVVGNGQDPEAAAPHMIHTIITGGDVNDQLQSDLTDHVSTLEGYRRTRKYKPVEQLADGSSRLVFISEFETLDTTKLASLQKAMEDSIREKKCALKLRAYELLESEGFNGECRVPARL